MKFNQMDVDRLAKIGRQCERLRKITPVVGEPDELWWQRQSALDSAAGNLLDVSTRLQMAIDATRDIPTKKRTSEFRVFCWGTFLAASAFAAAMEHGLLPFAPPGTVYEQLLAVGLLGGCITVLMVSRTPAHKHSEAP